MQTAKAQTSLHIRAVWSELLLFANTTYRLRDLHVQVKNENLSKSARIHWLAQVVDVGKYLKPPFCQMWLI